MSYEWWENALEGRFGPVTDMPECGFYRMKSGGDFWMPVAVWPANTGAVFVQIAKEDPRISEDDDGVRDTWLRCAKYPVPEEAYRHAIATGQWPGEAPASREAIGSNKPPEGPDALLAAMDETAAEHEAWVKGRRIESQADVDACETRTNALLALKKQAVAAHKTEKQPSLDAGRVVDRKWNPRIGRIDEVVRALKAAATPFLNARREEKRQAAAAAVARGDPAPVRAQMNATTSGTSGKKLHLRTHKWAVVTDWDAAVVHFKDHPDVHALVQRLADKLAEIGAPVPWAEFRSEQRAA